jgi:hypothetical protein
MSNSVREVFHQNSKDRMFPTAFKIRIQAQGLQLRDTVSTAGANALDSNLHGLQRILHNESSWNKIWKRSRTAIKLTDAKFQ